MLKHRVKADPPEVSEIADTKTANESKVENTDQDQNNVSGLSVKASGLDAGNKSIDHYKSAMSPFRFHLREKCLPYVRKETEILYKIQTKIRHPILDYYFAWTANLASHTFYVLMLPLSNWFGSASMARDLVYVLGLGIYFTGNFKDFMCLPRPRSPPLHRITMSTYTTQEYGFPSSHSANATAVTLIMVHKVLSLDFSFTTKAAIFFAVFLYYISLIFGRIYCGMHGFFDVLTGSLIGTALFLFRLYLGDAWDNLFILDLNNNFGYFLPVLVIAFYLALIHIHFEPVDDCPCFDDSVAFIGVLIGLDISHWLAQKTEFFLTLTEDKNISPIIINYDYSKLGLIKTALRVIFGILLVVAWQIGSKPIVFTILPPIYKFMGLNIARKSFIATAFTKKSNRQIRKTSISNLTEAELNLLLPEIKNDDGVQNESDYYEMLNYQKEPGSEKEFKSQVFRPRYDVEIVGRLIIYAGVAATSVWGFAIITKLLHLGC